MSRYDENFATFEKHVDNFNLDGISRKDLMSIWAAIHAGPVRAARRLFPERPKGYVAATRLLSGYASNKAAAIACREKGDLAGAGVYETICERIYEKLPSFARW